MRLTQILDDGGKRALVVSARGESRLVKGARTTLALVNAALAGGVTLRKLVAERGVGKIVDLARSAERRAIPAGNRDKTGQDHVRGI